MKKVWWKLATVGLLLYVFTAGLLIEAPRLPILNETVRNLFFHVPMWFSMMIIFTVSMVYAVKYLNSGSVQHDIQSSSFAYTGMLLGLLGFATGMVWAKFTWGDWWVNDPKINGAAITLFVYLAYSVLRGSFTDDQQRARISAVYNIFAFAVMIPLIVILPRVTDSLHPGNGGNPGFSTYDSDDQLKVVFYPAVIGWTLLGVWIATLRARIKKIEEKQYEEYTGADKQLTH